MEYEFNNKHLIDLYQKGSSKKYKFVTKSIAKKMLLRINAISASDSIYDLYEPPSMEFEALEGIKDGFSIRIDQKHRLEFMMNFEDEEKTYGKVTITNVSKHYE